MSNLICPITYKPLQSSEKYSLEGLHKLSPQLHTLKELSLSAEQQRYEATLRAHKMSIQGVQPKLSAKLSIKQSQFEIVDMGGQYILKPQNQFYPELPENEDLTMRLAAAIGIEVPPHGLLYGMDGSLTYFIKRFDRASHKQKIALEDFAQLAGKSRDTKYEFSTERLIPIINAYCTFPLLEKRKLLQRTLFNFLVGNEDMHLKNFSLITRNQIVELAPAYDFLNTSIVLGKTTEELALPLHGKKSNLKKTDLINYFAYEKLNLNEKVVAEILETIGKQLLKWQQLIGISFLSDEMKRRYLTLLDNRRIKLDL